jgi:cardiolipin synthase A/B
MELAGWLTTTLFIAELLVQLTVAARVLMRRLPTGATTSWLVLILLLPIFGAVAYLLVGESRIGHHRLRREREVHPAYAAYISRLRHETSRLPSSLSRIDERLSREAELVGGLPTLTGNDLRLLEGDDAFFREVLAMIEGAERSVWLEFFIWHSAGRVREVEAALARAAARGVACRVLVDAVGSRAFLRARAARSLRASGVRVVGALPPRIGRTPIVRRIDHRNHRKLVIVDDSVAMAGSMNMADPECFKSGAGVGRWIDLMAAVRGPAVETLALVAIRDWEAETGEDVREFRDSLASREISVAGEMPVQAVPSGPGLGEAPVHALVLSAIYAAERELTITTPYFVPDQPVVAALQSAARRGVKTTVLLPARCDTVLTHNAGRAFFGDLLDAGVRVAEYHGGLLHTKSIIVDEEAAMFGTVNIDPRSFWLNFELTLMVYDNEATRLLAEVQERYLRDATLVDPERWRRRPVHRKVLANVAQLFSPLL